MSDATEFVELFLQEAGERLQFLREYAGILQDPYPSPEDVERLFVAAHTLEGSSGLYGFRLLREISSKLSHIFQYAMNMPIASDAAAALVEFILEAVSLLESDLLMISAVGRENADELESFKTKYAFAFQPQPGPVAEHRAEPTPIAEPAAEKSIEPELAEPVATSLAASDIPDLPPDGDLPREILDVFLPEAEEHLQVIQECLLAMEAHVNAEDVHRLFRAMHTIKGSAAQVGLHRLSRVAHRTEDLVGKIRDGVLSGSSEAIDLCFDATDVIKNFVFSRWESEEQLQSTVKQLLRRIDAFAPEEDLGIPIESLPTGAADVMPTTEAEPVTPPDTKEADSPLAASVDENHSEPEPEFIAGLRTKEASSVPQSKSVRIALERLDSMMNAVGELVINRTRMLGRLGELERLAEILNFSKARMSDKIEGFQAKYEFGQLLSSSSLATPAPFVHHVFPSHHARGFSMHQGSDPHGEFSELEMDRYDDFNILSRSLTEISSDITEVLTQLDGFVRKIDQDIDEFTKLAHRLQDEITQSRMVPIGNLYTRISRTVRDASKASGKQVDLKLSGSETELDNNIIQQISDPLIHLVRNAVAHGLESPEDRYHAGKSDVGSVAVRAYHRGNHIFIEVEDDGDGIHFEVVRQRAVDLGIVAADEAEALTETQLTDLLFHPGFTTVERKTELAGRGVGLDVVKANIAALNGEIAIDTRRGLGTRFTLKVPLTLIISQALFVRCSKETFALPLASVEEIRLLPQKDLEEVGGKLLTKVRDVVTEVVRLDTQLGLDPIQPVNGVYRMVIVSVNGRQVGLVVEDVLRKDEIVIKSLGGYMRNVRLFPGATIAPDGSLILLIDLNRLIAGDVATRPLSTPANAARVFSPGSTAVTLNSLPKSASDLAVEKVVLLADDSISVRKFVGGMLEKAGYRVSLASDGLEALEMASQGHVDLIVSDLEMPRTNGYELMAHLRQNQNTREIPVAIVTSRAGAKHRDRAMKEGAVAFLTKPVQEDQLIETVKKLIGPANAAAARNAVYATA